MPNSDTGYSGDEIVDMVVEYIGNQSSQFRSYIEKWLPLAEFKFCKMHDWKFLLKRNRPLTVASGTDEYTLSVANIGYYMVADEVDSIFSIATGIYLKKTDLETIRRMDVKQDNGSAVAQLTHWAPVSDNQIIVYPKTFSDTALRIDGPITPSALLDLSNYPTIPFRYQDSFIKYVMGEALDRENDSRAASTKQEAMTLLRQDIQDDMGKSGSIDEARFKHWWEMGNDGVGGDLEQQYLSWIFR